MRQYWFVIYKGDKVSPGFDTKESAIKWARNFYDLDDVQFVRLLGLRRKYYDYILIWFYYWIYGC